MVCYTHFTMEEWNGGERLPHDFQKLWYKMLNLVYKILNIYLFREGFIKNNIKGMEFFKEAAMFSSNWVIINIIMVFRRIVAK